MSFLPPVSAHPTARHTGATGGCARLSRLVSRKKTGPAVRLCLAGELPLGSRAHPSTRAHPGSPARRPGTGRGQGGPESRSAPKARIQTGGQPASATAGGLAALPPWGPGRPWASAGMRMVEMRVAGTCMADARGRCAWRMRVAGMRVADAHGGDVHGGCAWRGCARRMRVAGTRGCSLRPPPPRAPRPFLPGTGPHTEPAEQARRPAGEGLTARRMLNLSLLRKCIVCFREDRNAAAGFGVVHSGRQVGDSDGDACTLRQTTAVVCAGVAAPRPGTLSPHPPPLACRSLSTWGPGCGTAQGAAHGSPEGRKQSAALSSALKSTHMLGAGFPEVRAGPGRPGCWSCPYGGAGARR